MKNDIKEIIKKNNTNSILVYLVALFILGAILFISFIALMVKGYSLFGVICLLLGVIFITLGIILKVRANNTNWEQMTFDVEKDFDINLLYSDNYLALSNNYILFYKSKSVFKINNILFYFVNNNNLKLFVRDDNNTIYDFSFKYSNQSIFNNIVSIIDAKAFDSKVLYRDYLFMFSSNALYDLNKICGKEVIILKEVREIIRSSQNEFLIHAIYNGKDINGVYRYNDVNMCDQTFNYLCNKLLIKKNN